MIELLSIIGLAIWLALSTCPLALTHCCCGCNYFTDAFAVDNLATDYTTVSGAWTVSGGTLNTASSNAILVANTTSTNNYHRITATFGFSPAGDIQRLIGGYADSSNFLYLQLTHSSTQSEVKLFKRVAGVNTQIGSTKNVTASAEGYTLTLCCDPDGTVGSATANGFLGTVKIIAVNEVSAGNQCGFATGAITGTAAFDSLTFQNVYQNNTKCESCLEKCNHCIDLIVPGIIVATVNTSGTTNSPCDPEVNCASIDGSAWSLQRVGSAGEAGETECPEGTASHGSCFWYTPDFFEVTPTGVPICDIAGTGIDRTTAGLNTLWITPTGKVWARFQIIYAVYQQGYGRNCAVYSAQLPGSGPYDCTALNGLTLAYRGMHNSGPGNYRGLPCDYDADEGGFQFCDMVGSTVTLQVP